MKEPAAYHTHTFHHLEIVIGKSIKTLSKIFSAAWNLPHWLSENPATRDLGIRDPRIRKMISRTICQKPTGLLT